MSMRSFTSWLTLFIGVAVLGGILAGSAAFAQTEGSRASMLAEALDHRIYGRFDEGLAITERLLKQDDLSSQDSIAIMEVMSIIYFSKGEDYYKRSYELLEQMSNIGPCILNLPHNIWPKGLRSHWFSLVGPKGALVCDESTSPGHKTIAVMPFDNYSVGKFQEELGELGAGLASFFQYDFAKISSLTVVERDKIEYILKEQELAAGGKVDQATAIKAGKILGAQLMVFGSFTQIDDRQTRLVIRAVSVETSEIIASVSADGRPDYFKLEKQLVQQLAEELEIPITDEDKKLIDQGGTESLDATSLYAKGLGYEDQYDYQSAYAAFKKAYELDPGFTEAKERMEIYRPIAG